MRDFEVYLNGIWQKEKEARVPIANRSFLIGEGIFETFPALQSVPLFFNEHFQRLEQSALSLHWTLPCTRAELSSLVKQSLQRNRLSSAVIRIYLTAEGEKMGDYSSPPTKIELLISTRPYPSPPQKSGGAEVVLVRSVIAPQGILSNLKTTCYLPYHWAKREAQERGASEGILQNGAGQITEGGSSNLFIVRQGEILTPPLESGVLAGIVRSQVLTLANSIGKKGREAVLFPQDLFEADELFLTNSVKGILPIQKIEGKPTPASPGPITEQLMREYQKRIEKEIRLNRTGD